MYVLGIDPGADGGWAVLQYQDKIVYPVESLGFTNKTSESLAEQMLRVRAVYDPLVVMEAVGAMKLQGASTSFKFGEVTGFMRGLLAANKLPYDRVAPQTWQRIYLHGKKFEKTAERKRALKAIAEELFPAMKPTLQTADAMLIANWYCQNK
jgi:Holliday junction resolvasome RuvABC endonuclease subunit